MPDDKKTEGEKSEAELRREGEERARQANSRRNTERLDRLSAIADSAEESGDHVGDEELTEEMLADAELTEEQRTARAIAKAQAEGGEDDVDERETEIEEAEEDQGDEPRNDQGEEARDDEARNAGAEDVRVRDGVKEYELVINGKRVWRSLAQIRAAAQKVESADEYLETAVETAKRATRAGPTDEQKAEAARQRSERVAKRKDLLKRVALGDEAAIDELAELDEQSAAPSAVTPDVLRALDERFDSRVSFREAVNWFEDEYDDVLRHQAMKSYAGELDAALAAKNPTMPPKERLRRVGDQIRRELKETYGLTARQGPSEKARRKAEAPRKPAPAGERRQERGEEEEVEDTSSVIQKMAQARHQPRAVVHGPIRGR